MSPVSRTSTARHIGIFLFDEVEELDAVGPWEVLAHWTLEYPEDGWSVSCLSRDGASVTGAKGLVLGAHHSCRMTTLSSASSCIPAGRGRER